MYVFRVRSAHVSNVYEISPLLASLAGVCVFTGAFLRTPNDEMEKHRSLFNAPPPTHPPLPVFRIRSSVRFGRLKQDYAGCQLSGFIMVNRVPGNFHIEARSAVHSIDPTAANVR